MEQINGITIKLKKIIYNTTGNNNNNSIDIVQKQNAVVTSRQNIFCIQNKSSNGRFCANVIALCSIHDGIR